jgi:hypothetical protein
MGRNSRKAITEKATEVPQILIHPFNPSPLNTLEKALQDIELIQIIKSYRHFS